MDAMGTRALITNQRIADDLGVTHSAISRIRSGDRRPSLEVMLKIMDIYGWSLEVQALAWTMGQYSAEFEIYLAEHYDQ